jgi:hypothetical protein
VISCVQFATIQNGFTICLIWWLLTWNWIIGHQFELTLAHIRPGEQLVTQLLYGFRHFDKLYPIFIKRTSICFALCILTNVISYILLMEDMPCWIFIRWTGLRKCNIPFILKYCCISFKRSFLWVHAWLHWQL